MYKCFSVLALFVLVAGLVFVDRPERHAQTSTINLSAIPTDIGDWHMISQDTSIGKGESKFLDDVLFRIYERKDGKTIMFAVAYGADQRKNFSIHLPEVCYKAAGYEIIPVGQVLMNFPSIKVKQLMATRSTEGIEAIQYWIVLNGKVVTNEFDRKLKHVYYGIVGTDAGGVLLRVSSLSTFLDCQQDYKDQNEFIHALYKSLKPEMKRLLFGAEA